MRQNGFNFLHSTVWDDTVLATYLYRLGVNMTPLKPAVRTVYIL